MGRQRGLSLGKRLKHYPRGVLLQWLPPCKTCAHAVYMWLHRMRTPRFSRFPDLPFPRFTVSPFSRFPVFPFSRFPVFPFPHFPVFPFVPFFCFPSFSLGKRLKYYPRELLLQWLPPCKTCAHAVYMWLRRGQEPMGDSRHSPPWLEDWTDACSGPARRRRRVGSGASAWGSD